MRKVIHQAYAEKIDLSHPGLFRKQWQKIATISFLCLVHPSCGESGGGNSGGTTPTEDFPSSLLTTYMKWTPVLNGDVAFPSSGHSGQTTRVFFNDVALPHFKDEKSLPFAAGSYLAKAVVKDADTQAASASRVYFMLKKDPGFDSSNADWSYAVANIENGTLEFESSQGKLSSCFGCHKAEATWDYVRTVDYFRKQSAE